MSRRNTRGLTSEAVRVDVFKETVTVTDYEVGEIFQAVLAHANTACFPSIIIAW